MSTNTQHGEHEHEHLGCDRPSAREARKVVTNLLLPLASSLGAQLSPSCPLSPEQDHLAPHEAAKHALSPRQWRCNACGKLFNSEHYIDLHLERKHPRLLNSSATACLGEYCDLLQCPSWISALRRAEAERPRPCKPAELEARRHACQHLMHDCFLLSGGEGGDLHPVFEAMEERFCRPVSCAGRAQIRAHGSLLAVPDHAPGDHADGRGAVYYLLGGGLLASLAVLYCLVFVSMSEARGSGDELRARRGRARGGKWWWPLGGSSAARAKQI